MMDLQENHQPTQTHSQDQYKQCTGKNRIEEDAGNETHARGGKSGWRALGSKRLDIWRVEMDWAWMVSKEGK